MYVCMCVCVCVYMCVCVCMYMCILEVCIYVYMGKNGNKADSMTMYRDEKTQGFQRIILYLKIFANIKRFGF